MTLLLSYRSDFMQESILPDLTVDFCGLKLPNPLILGSGGLGESSETLLPYLNVGAAAVITRTIRLNVSLDRKVFPSPHLFISPRRQYMLNCEWGNLAPWDYWLKKGLPFLKEYGNVIVSISGRHIQDCVDLAIELEPVGISLFEINISCSHSGLLYGRIMEDSDHIFQLVSTLKKVLKTPIMLKLGWSPVLSEIAKIAVKAGVDAISTTNSIGPGLDVRLEDGRPQLGIQGGAGGLSGKAIFPIALECVNLIAQTVNVPIMGIGGITSYQEVVKMLMVGAHCVQIYTEAFLQGPKIFPKILDDLTSYMKVYKHSSVKDIVGVSQAYLSKPSNIEAIIPEVIEERCTACNLCSKVCTVNAIDLQHIAVINPNLCIGCGACLYVCPPKFNALKWP